MSCPEFLHRLRNPSFSPSHLQLDIVGPSHSQTWPEGAPHRLKRRAPVFHLITTPGLIVATLKLAEDPRLIPAPMNEKINVLMAMPTKSRATTAPHTLHRVLIAQLVKLNTKTTL
ncbi:hypothetical protein PHLCEN_2v9058 [Hermanssonia centrifuga]|uniref:Uncharacterized protein n=1 Tax=Hermanssonia centrifuga TaxID=98765 RepID=A0A2R6NRV4_9APHY|nr:hypothetical protein PHLCEN_2v9058 [Hermanssonia centrifuga]